MPLPKLMYIKGAGSCHVVPDKGGLPRALYSFIMCSFLAHCEPVSDGPPIDS